MTTKRHILLIDPLEKLVIKKDSSLLLALSMKERGIPVCLVFEDDFFCANKGPKSLTVTDFEGEFLDGGPYLKEFKLTRKYEIQVGTNDVFHMRLDPPFDSRYLRILWMLKMWKSQGADVINSPEGIAAYNEKLFAYEQADSLQTYIGSSYSAFLNYVSDIKKKGVEFLIFKPLDLYQGMGVEKLSINDDLQKRFQDKVKECHGPIIAQPFDASVTRGEVRSLYFMGKELGSILKVPPAGAFLANIVQGASYDVVELNDIQRKACEKVCHELMEVGVPWVAFDILGNNVSEVNITCPGLLVEVSKAKKKNLAFDIIDLLG